uniref:Homologous recombination OB-fold protein OB-fold domain-containing protein n=1 Tax=Tanacetum cinerariifolium TaxID=118510 RepID=A0A6L2KHG3_TANCI|nr:hypothetical protein [Tanacetum cinerariifolium]
MACSVSHTYDEIKATIEKQIENDKARQLAIMNLAVEYDNFCGAKDNLRKAYELCNHIPQETRAFLKEGSNKDYKLHNSLFGKTAKIEKQINAKLVWLREKYNYRLQTHIGGSSSQTREICDVYLTEKELHQLHLDQEALREIVEEEEEARDEKEREGKVRQKQADDEEYYLKFGVKVVEDVGDDEDFKRGPWVSTTDYVHITGSIVTGCLGDIKNFLKNEKLEQVVALVKSCSSNSIGDLTVTMKYLSGAAMILANISVFTPKPSKHHLNITMRNVVKVFHKDTIPGSGSGSG